MTSISTSPVNSIVRRRFQSRGSDPSSNPYSHLPVVATGIAIALLLEYVAWTKTTTDYNPNVVGPVILMLSCVWGAYAIVKKVPVLFLSALPWCLLASAAYWGAGSLVLELSNDATKYSYARHLMIDDEELLRANILNAVFTLIVVVIFSLVSKKRIKSSDTCIFLDNIMDLKSAKLLVFLCVVIGLPIRLFICIPYEFGLIPFEIPATVYRIGMFVTLCLIPLWFLVGAKQYQFLPAAILLLILEFSFGVISYAKSAVLISILLAGVGYYISNNSRLVLGMFVTSLVGTYLFVAPIVTTCREVTAVETGKAYGANLSQRLQVLADVYNDKDYVRSNTSQSEVSQGWRRLNYSNAQVWVMNRYDAGHAFDFYKNALWVFVPRILVADKPSMTQIGTDLNDMINGNKESSMAIGIGAEAYGVGGFAMVLVIAVFTGLLYSYWDSNFSFYLAGGWLYLPAQVIIMRMGYRVDGALVPDYLGSSVLVLGYGFIIRTLIVYSFGSKTLSVPQGPSELSIPFGRDVR